MTLRFTDSFDHYVTADLTEKWTSLVATPVIEASTGRRSTASLKCVAFFGGSAVSKTLDAQGTWIVGVAAKFTTLNAVSLISLYDAGSRQCDVRLKSDGTFEITRNGTVLGTTTFAASSGVYYYLELKVVIHNSAGTAELKVDGSSKLALTGQDTQATANATANQVAIGDTLASGIHTAVYDDLYICDGAGSVNNDFLGDCRVDAYVPSGAGNSTQLTPSAGSNYQCVDESAPNDDTDYVEHATVGNKDTYAVTDMSHTPSSIFGVQVLANAKKDDAGARSIATVTRSGGADTDGATQTLSTSYVYYQQIVEQDPNGPIAWTKTNLNNGEFGIKVAA